MVHNATLITCMPPQSGSGTVRVTVCTTVFVDLRLNHVLYSCTDIHWR